MDDTAYSALRKGAAAYLHLDLPLECEAGVVENLTLLEKHATVLEGYLSKAEGE
ncbi:hypothetical protein [Asticcacaulis sp. YBE204]|uniref:hypothetical protein n=1 Tax=Asticcacaulis sp. YBE204 TaxID=1282363 RepID=UPI0003C3D2C3|nr:hypothetical protein [Asticcacaulis sp. YBE204]ESQ79079.1 hypothetical protein AEYBE204_11685 [Asticcacaulis sp. YBE204]